jgi:hypothetical protein
VFALFVIVLFALMQKERKKSRAKYASTHMPTRHPAFGSGHRAVLFRNDFIVNDIMEKSLNL